jgi:hypothetical protein
MSLNASSTGEAKEVQQLFQVVAAISAVYGDPDGKYREFLEQCGISGKPILPLADFSPERG